jgi:hypothetical protein
LLLAEKEMWQPQEEYIPIRESYQGLFVAFAGSMNGGKVRLGFVSRRKSWRGVQTPGASTPTSRLTDSTQVMGRGLQSHGPLSRRVNPAITLRPVAT